MTEKKTSKPTSEASARANRNNAKRSTGPKTSAGKATSSANATIHGAYARPLRPLTVGPHKEDPAQLLAFHAAIVERLAPRDALEETSAAEIARLLTAQQRVAAFEGAILDDGWFLTVEEQRAAGGPEADLDARVEALSMLHYWEAGTASGEATGARRVPKEGEADARPTPSSVVQMAMYAGLVDELTYQGWPRDPWAAPKGKASSSATGEEDYLAQLEALVDYAFVNRDHYKSWLVNSVARYLSEIEAFRARVAAISAAKALASLDRSNGVRARVNAELRTELMHFAWLRGRLLE